MIDEKRLKMPAEETHDLQSKRARQRAECKHLWFQKLQVWEAAHDKEITKLKNEVSTLKKENLTLFCKQAE